MPAYKEKDRNTWTVKFKHRNWDDKIKWVTKRGFATKREALQYERDFLARMLLTESPMRTAPFSTPGTVCIMTVLGGTWT